MSTKIVLAVCAVLVAIASPQGAAFAATKTKPVFPADARGAAVDFATAPAGRDAVTGKMLGTDPDPRIRFELMRDRARGN